MKKDIPKGLIAFSVILIISAIWAVSILFRADPNMIYLGKIFSGLPFKMYYVALGILNLIISFGVIKLRRWSYICFMILTAYVILISILNVVLTNVETLLQVGWKLSDNNMSSFYLVQGLAITLSAIMFAWLHRYRKLLR